ncbi:MAG: AMP-binding protein [Clostridia bacterium]|nr:AMP-binding protein [Clostridia bacterium]
MIFSENTNNGVKVTVDGRLDTNTAPELRRVLGTVPDDTALLVIDLGNTLYISSAGLRELLIARKRFRDDRMKIVSVSDSVMDIFRISGFDTILPVEQGNRADFVHLSIRDFIREKAASCGDRAVLRDSEKDWTWTDIDLGSDAMAHRLRRMGVRKGSHVGIAGLNSVNFILCLYAVQKLGALAVLMNFNLKPSEIITHITAGDVAFMCVGNLPYRPDRDAFFHEIRSGAAGLEDLFFFEDLPAGQWVAEGAACPLESFAGTVEPDDPCLMLFTSGSTGKPKGVILSAYNVLNAAEISKRSQNLTGDSVSCNILPLFHVFGLVAGLFAGAFADALLVLPKDLHMSTLMETIEKNRCTVFHAVPTLFLALLTNPEFRPERIASLRCTILSGAAATKAQLDLFREKLPDNRFLSSYGLSEAAPVTITEYEDTGEHITDTVGKPMEHIEMKIVSVSDGHECAPGETGEILVQGYNLMAGYYKADLDSQSIDTDGWLHTGDLGFLREDGYLHLDGRLKELIIRGGENIMPLDVAQAVSALPGISDVKVVGVPSDFYGEEVAACIVLKPGAEFDEKAAKSILSGKIAAFKIPSYFFIFDEFPVLSNGKQDSLAIAAEAERRAADAHRH